VKKNPVAVVVPALQKMETNRHTAMNVARAPMPVIVSVAPAGANFELNK
jgi:hypothetical protein